jgi:hypothetical protein
MHNSPTTGLPADRQHKRATDDIQHQPAEGGRDARNASGETIARPPVREKIHAQLGKVHVCQTENAERPGQGENVCQPRMTWGKAAKTRIASSAENPAGRSQTASSRPAPVSTAAEPVGKGMTQPLCQKAASTQEKNQPRSFKLALAGFSAMNRADD